MLVFCLPQGGVPSAMKFFTPSDCHARREYLSECELAFLETAWNMGYLTHLDFHPHLIKPTKAEWTLKVKEKTVLDHVVFWCGCADQQGKTR